MVLGTYGPGAHDNLDISALDSLTAKVIANQGQDPPDGDTTSSGGDAGSIEGDVDVLGASTIDVHVSGGQTSPAGNGGDGGSQTNATAGDGGGVSALRVDTSYVLAAGGGGGGAAYDTADGSAGGGGGGAWGGAGGDSLDGQAGTDGAAPPSAFSNIGGDGGDQNGNTSSDLTAGGPGGTEAQSSVTVVSTGFSNPLFSTGGTVEITSITWDVDPRTGLSATENAGDIDLAWTDVSDSADELRVYRSTSTGVDNTDTLVATLGPNDTSYTDTTVQEGTTYYYTVAAYGDAEAEETFEYSNEDSATTPLPAPTGLSVDAITNDSADLSWTDNATDEDGYRVYQRLTGGTFSQVADLAANSTTYTATGLLNGRDYEWQVEAYTQDVTSSSSIVGDTTVLPDVDALPLDASIEDELTAQPSTTPALNHGSWFVEYKETDVSTWTTWGSTNYTNDPTITGLQDGEKYDVRVRAETVDVTGAFFSAAEVTLLPAPTNVAFPTVQETSVDVTWTDNADNEDEQHVQRRRPDYPNPSWETIATVAADVTSYTDSTVHPGREYQYRIRAETEHVYANSSPATVETTSLGVPQTRTRRSQWTVEIDHPSGRTLTPPVAENPEYRPQVNGLPGIRVPVPPAGAWASDDILEQPIRVWYEGVQLPIDEVVAVDQESSDAVAVIEAQGGSQLQRYADDVQYAETESHTAAEAVITSKTDYAATVDDPDSSTRSDVRMIGAGDREGFEDWFGGDIAATDPVAALASTQNLHLLQTGFFVEAEDTAGTWRSWNTDADNWYSGSQAIRLGESGEHAEFNVNLDYTVPAGELDIQILYALADTSTSPAFEVLFDGSVVDSFPEDFFTSTGGNDTVNWTFLTTVNVSSQTDAGSHTVEFRVDSPSGDDFYVDAFWVGDGRFSYTFDDTVQNDAVSGPELYPASYTVESKDADSVEQVVAGEITITTDDTTGGQAVALSNDSGSTWESASNTASFSTEFTSTGAQIRARLTLARYTTDSTTSPTNGDTGQYVDEVLVDADLDDTPLLIDKQYRDNLVGILNRIAETGDFVWEVHRDPTAAVDDATGFTVEWTQAGQRERESDAAVVDFSTRRTVEDSYDRVVVFGASDSVEDREFTTQSYGTEVFLVASWVVPDSETIYDPSDGTEFERNTDYEIDYKEGGVTPLSGGSMQENTTYEADFQTRYRGQATLGDTSDSDPNAIEERVASATSDRECRQLALAILKRIQEPLEEVEASVATDDPTTSLLDALTHPDIPFEGPVVPREKEVAPGRVTWRLGSRRSVTEVIGELRSRLQALHDQS